MNHDMIMIIELNRLEKVNLRKIHSLAKVIGTAVTVSGAMVMTLYKGPALQIMKGHGGDHHETGSGEPNNQHWVLGTLMLIASCGGWASFFILQVSYIPPKILSTSFTTSLQQKRNRFI